MTTKIRSSEASEEHFNCTKLPNWNSLTDSERYWTGCLARQADDNGWVKEWRYGSALMYLETWPDNDPGGIARAQCWCCESLMLALTTQNQTYMLRSLLQASEYLGRLHEPDPSYMATFSEAYQVAKIRAERLLIPRES